MSTEKVIELQGLVTRLGTHVVHDGLDIAVVRNEVLGIIGGSGTGKSVLLRVMIMLLEPSEGSLKLFGHRVDRNTPRQEIRRRFGVMFQSGGLFSDLSVLENVRYPLSEFTRLPAQTIDALARLKLSLVGLPADAANRNPSQLSGGMLKRAAIARALAMDPELIFLDEPSAGLDPVSVAELDELIITLRDNLGMTVVMISHELESLSRVTNRVAFLGDKKVLDCGPIKDVRMNTHPLIAGYFSASRHDAGSAHA